MSRKSKKLLKYMVKPPNPQHNKVRDMSDELIPCPFCNGEFKIEYVAGTCVDFVCLGDCGLICGDEQIVDHMTIEERNEEDAYNKLTHEYAPRFVERVKQAIAIRMNTRAPQAASSELVDRIKAEQETLKRHAPKVWVNADRENFLNLITDCLNALPSTDSVTISEQDGEMISMILEMIDSQGLFPSSKKMDIELNNRIKQALEANHTK
jgi:hypothetical protein